ncbi:MAG: hypothetical protein IIB26_10170 [Chloroflexi bacterium]|nr:hypothetical protein [Chloroflexota bacterium]
MAATTGASSDTATTPNFFFGGTGTFQGFGGTGTGGFIRPEGGGGFGGFGGGRRGQGAQ